MGYQGKIVLLRINNSGFNEFPFADKSLPEFLLTVLPSSAP